MTITNEDIVKKLPKTEDGFPYIPTIDTLWQIDPAGWTNRPHDTVVCDPDPQPWSVVSGAYNHVRSMPLFSSKEAALESLLDKVAKPCPFCYEFPTIREPNPDVWEILCTNGGCLANEVHAFGDTKEEVLANWNTRRVKS